MTINITNALTRQQSCWKYMLNSKAKKKQKINNNNIVSIKEKSEMETPNHKEGYYSSMLGIGKLSGSSSMEQEINWIRTITNSNIYNGNRYDASSSTFWCSVATITTTDKLTFSNKNILIAYVIPVFYGLHNYGDWFLTILLVSHTQNIVYIIDRLKSSNKKWPL